MNDNGIRGLRILSVSSILPIPGILKHNDFVFQTYKYMNRLYNQDKVVIIKPVKYDFNLKRIIRKMTRLQKLGRQYTRTIDDFRVEIFPFLSSWGYRNIHAILTLSIYFLNLRRIRSLFRTHHFEVIHAQYLFPDGLLAYMIHKKYHIPYFVTTHNERYYFDHFLSRTIGLKIMRNAARVLPINYTNYLHYKSLGVKNIDLLPLGYDKSFLRKQKLNTSGEVSIFTAAELIKLKNIDRVLYAMKNLVPVYPCKYTIIGTGPEKESLVNLAVDLGIRDSVTFIDHIPHHQIADEMYKYDIFIMPSYFETFGRVYFEAMAMGIPVICAKNSGIYGIFRDKEEGLAVDPYNADDMADALAFLISHPEERMQMGRNGQKLVQGYTWENIAEKLHSYYKANEEKGVN